VGQVKLNTMESKRDAPATKICTKCDLRLPLHKFGKRSPNKDGYDSCCIECDRVWRKEYQKKYYRENKKANLSRAMKKNYGITMEDKEKILEIQEYACAICSVKLELIERSSCVDHNHDTGAVRGVICHNCNSMLGGARDNPDVLFSGAKYLVGHNTMNGVLVENRWWDN